MAKKGWGQLFYRVFPATSSRNFRMQQPYFRVLYWNHDVKNVSVFYVGRSRKGSKAHIFRADVFLLASPDAL